MPLPRSLSLTVEPNPTSSWKVPSRSVTRTMHVYPTLNRPVDAFFSSNSFDMFSTVELQPLKPKMRCALSIIRHASTYDTL